MSYNYNNDDDIDNDDEEDNVELDYITMLSNEKLWDEFCDVNKYTQFNKEEHLKFKETCYQFLGNLNRQNNKISSAFDAEG